MWNILYAYYVHEQMHMFRVYKKAINHHLLIIHSVRLPGLHSHRPHRTQNCYVQTTNNNNNNNNNTLIIIDFPSSCQYRHYFKQQSQRQDSELFTNYNYKSIPSSFISTPVLCH
jgi:hypothetical protein